MENGKYITLLNTIVKQIEKDKLTTEQTAGLIKIIEQVSKSKTSILKMLPKNAQEQESLKSNYELLESIGLLKIKG